MNSSSKNFAMIVIVSALAIAAVHSLGGTHVSIDGDDVDGPLGAIIATMFAGGGLLVAAAVLTGVMALLGLLFAGLGILMVVALGVLAAVLLACISPLLLPLMIPIGLYWLFSAHQRRSRAKEPAL